MQLFNTNDENNNEIELTARDKFEIDFDQAIHLSSRTLDGDFHLIDEDTEYDDFYEQFFHCGICTTREVMNIVWPSVENYISYLEDLVAANLQDTQGL